MCVWHDIDFPGGAHDISGQNKHIGQNWMGYCAEECDKITDCTAMTVGKIISSYICHIFPHICSMANC